MGSLFKEGTIGAILFKTQVITEKDIAAALEEQKKSGLRFGEALVKLGIVKQEDIDWALSHQLDIPYVRMHPETVDPDAVRLVPAHLARRHMLLPLIRTGDELSIAIADPLNMEAVAEVEKLTGCSVSISMGLLQEIRKMQDLFYGAAEDSGAPGFVSSSFAPAVVDAINSDATGAVLLDNLLSHMLEKNLSSLTMKAAGGDVSVTGKSGGRSSAVGTFPLAHYAGFISTLRERSGIPPAAEVTSCGTAGYGADGEGPLFQVVVTRVGLWDYVTIRPVATSPFPESIAGLDTTDDNRRALLELSAARDGIVFFCGATGVERSRLMGLCMDECSVLGQETLSLGTGRGVSALVTAVADTTPMAATVGGAPGERVEQVNNDVGELIHAACSHDPDVVAVDELFASRDFTEAISCSLGGRLVFAGLPAPDVRGAVRLLGHLAQSFPMLPASTRGVAACRGVRVLCPACKQEKGPPAGGFKLPEGTSVFYKAAGCPECGNTGYSGTRYLVEAMVLDDEAAKLIGGSAVKELIGHLAKKGFRSIADEALEMLHAGEITAEEFFSAAMTDGVLPWQK